MRRLVLTLGFSVLWGGYVASPLFTQNLVLDVVLVVLSGVMLGYASKAWWAVGALLLSVIVLAFPSVYTDGAAPDYSVGLIAAIGFVVVSVPSVLAGVGISRIRASR